MIEMNKYYCTGQNHASHKYKYLQGKSGKSLTNINILSELLSRVFDRCVFVFDICNT